MHMKKIFFYLGISLISLGLIFSGCRIAYVPNMQNVPMFQEKGEFRGTIGPSNFQLAFSPVNNMGILANGQFYTFNESNVGGEYKTQLTLLEGGAGAYFPMENTNRIVIETYGGGGVGNIRIRNTAFSSDNYRANTLRFFIQPSFGYTHDIVDFGISFRFNYLIFSSVDTVRFQEAGIDTYEVPELGSSYGFFETAFTVRLGYRYIKFHMQPQITLPIGMPSEESLRLGFIPFTFNIGMHINLAPRFRQ